MESAAKLFTAFVDLVKEVGPVMALFIAFFIAAHIMIFCLYRGRMNDRQAEIDRLAKENREYRMRFLKILDKNLGTGGSNDD